MTLDQFEKEFEILNGYFDRSPKKATSAAWFRQLEACDFDIFKKIVADYAEQHPDNHGKFWFPHLSEIQATYRRLKAGEREAGDNEIPSCKWCYHGKIYMDDEQGRSHIFRCGECDHWKLKHFHPMYPARFDEYVSKGWKVDHTLTYKWEQIKAGGWHSEDEVMSGELGRLKSRALLSGLGMKSDPDRERLRAESIREAEESEVPF